VLWYSTLVYESLRRLENGQADISAGQAEIIAAIKGMDIPTVEAIKSELRRGHEDLLKRELRKRTPSKRVTEQDIDVAKTYVTASPPERANIEHRSMMRSSTTQHRNGHGDYGSRDVTGGHSYEPDASNGDHGPAKFQSPPPPSGAAPWTYMKIRRKDVDPRTLEAYSLPWEWDDVSICPPPPFPLSLAHKGFLFANNSLQRSTQTTSSSKPGSPSTPKTNSSPTPKTSAKWTSSQSASAAAGKRKNRRVKTRFATSETKTSTEATMAGPRPRPPPPFLISIRKSSSRTLTAPLSGGLRTLVLAPGRNPFSISPSPTAKERIGPLRSMRRVGRRDGRPRLRGRRWRF